MKRLIEIDKIALPADIKHVTRRRILEVFKSGDKLTAMDVYSLTGISKPTVMRAIQYFCSLGVLESAGLGQASIVGGKKPEYFVFADNRKILCVALWPRGITLSLSSFVGDVYGITFYEHKLEDNLADVFKYLEQIAGSFLEIHEIERDELYGVELSTAGTVDYKNRLLRYNSQSPGWGRNIPLVDYLVPIFGANIEYSIENAGKTTGRSIILDQPELGAKRVLTVFSTWGVSACLIENGHILSGKDSLIGEIGHMTVSSTDGEVCGCGKKGCLERLVSIERVRSLLQDEGITRFEREHKVTFKTLFAASANGNEAARRIVYYLAKCYAIALHNLSLIYNPDVVVFQGDFAWADEYFDRCLMQEILEFRYYPEDGVFETRYDKRDLSLLDARGGAALLKRRYFADLESL